MRNWNTTEEALESLQKTIKRRQKATLFMTTETKDGEVYDTLKCEVISIKDATTSTLNRLSKSLNAMYKALDITDKRRDYVLSKKKEIDDERTRRQ